MKYRLWKNEKACWEIINQDEVAKFPELKSSLPGVFETNNINGVYRFLEYITLYYKDNNVKGCSWDIKEISDGEDNK